MEVDSQSLVLVRHYADDTEKPVTYTPDTGMEQYQVIIIIVAVVLILAFISAVVAMVSRSGVGPYHGNLLRNSLSFIV